MDLYYFVDKRLEFIEFLQNGATAHFLEIKRKVEVQEEPYVDNRDPEHWDEPAFLDEWQKADDATIIVSAASLDLLQSTLHAFLENYLIEIGLKNCIPRMKEMGEKGWFRKYNAFFEKHLQIDWAANGDDIDLLEQTILTRNDFSHNMNLTSLSAFQTEFHSEKYPDSQFADPIWKKMSMRPVRMSVPEEPLQQAIKTLRSLCRYLENERYKFMQRRREF